jgi:hypothetical protein
MGALEQRISRLEEELGAAYDCQGGTSEILRRLSDAELDWLTEPLDEGESRVPCPGHVESVECGCRSAERARRALEAFPEIGEEFERRALELVQEHGDRGGWT